MNEQTQIENIKKLVEDVLQIESGFFCVNIRIKPTNNIKVFIDGDNGISIEKCVYFNRSIYSIIEEKNFYPDGDFSLEVSSPGVDEPLVLQRQYLRNIGRNVEVLLLSGERKNGKLIEVSENDILLETTEGKGKKAKQNQELISKINIKTTTVQIKF